MSRKKRQKSNAPASSWLDTYADTITLLLTFFVLLYASSSANADKFQAMAQAFQSVLTGQGTKYIMDYSFEGGELPVVGDTTSSIDIPPPATKEEVEENMQEFIEQNGLEGKVDVVEDSRGYIFELKEKILFESGRAELKKESLPILNILTEYIKKIPNDIIIEGHTDNVPISNYRYKDNWQLSAARSYTVMSYFINEQKLEPTRFSAMFFGEQKPLVDNTTEENKAKNRRVNILIVTESSEDGGEGGEE